MVILEAMALKWVGGKAAAALGHYLAHASAASVDKAAFIGAHNVATAAGSASSAAAGVGILGSGATAGYKVYSGYAEEKKAQNNASGSPVHLSGLNPRDGTVYVTAVEMFNYFGTILALHYYREKLHTNELGKLKTWIRSMRLCRECHMDDFLVPTTALDDEYIRSHT